MSTLTAHLNRRRLAAITAAAAAALLAGASPTAAQIHPSASSGDTAAVSPAIGAAAGSAAAHARPQGGRPLPVAAWGPLSRALGRDDPAYRAVAGARGLTAANPAQRLRAWFAGGGALVRSGPLAVGLGLRGAGFGPRLAAVPTAAPVAAGNRVMFRYGRISEWFANGPLGLEQGFTVSAPPPGRAGGPLTLGMAWSGNARAALSPGREGVVFSRAGSALAYRGLTVSDARGTRLPAWLELRGRQLLLHVQTAGARYPLRVDPVIQQARLTASDGAAGDMLGMSVVISADGTTIVAAAPAATVNGHSAQGAVYVFVKPATGWRNAAQTAKLTARGGAAGDLLGSFGFQGVNGVAVSATGATIVAGAAGSGNSAGAVYVFTKPATGWHTETQAAKLTAFHGGTTDNLGVSVAISGNVIASGAPQATIGGHQLQGAVYVFTKPGTGWHNETQAAKLTASDGAQLDGLGLTVGISGPTVVAGAATATVHGNTNQGAAYVFTKPTTGWHNETQAAKLTASDGAAGAFFANSAAISGTVILLGAPNADQNQGAAYIFTKPTTGWHNETQAAKLTASNSSFLLGSSVAISGPLAAAGAGGAIYLFTKPGTGWHNQTQAAEATNPDYGPGMEALSGDTLAVGVPVATIGSNSNQGATDVWAYSTSGSRHPAAAQAARPARLP
jgi:trimeric autotransporter adhesin